MKFNELLKWAAAGAVLTLALIAAVTAFAAQITPRRAETITVYYHNVVVGIDGEVLDFTGVDGDEIEPFILDGIIFAPVRTIAEALDYNVREGSRGIDIITSRRAMPRVEGNTITKFEVIQVGYLCWAFDLTETVASGVTWELVSISDENNLTFLGCEYIPGAEGGKYATRRFMFGFSRYMPGNNTVELTFEQFLDGTPLHNFLVYEVFFAIPCAGGLWLW